MQQHGSVRRVRELRVPVVTPERRLGRTRYLAAAGAFGLILLIAAGLAVAAGLSDGHGSAPNVSAPGEVRYTDPGQPRTVQVPGTNVRLPAGSQELVQVAKLEVVRRANGKTYLVGPSVIPGVLCMVATPDGSDGEAPVGIGCDRDEVAKTKGMYLASDAPSGIDGGAYVGTGTDQVDLNGQTVDAQGGVVPFRLPTIGGTVRIERDAASPTISFAIAGR